MKAKDIQPKSAANVNEAVLAAWKKAYPTGISELCVYSGEFTTVKTGEGDETEEVPVVKYSGWIRKPTRNEMREFTAMAKSVDPVTYTERVLDTIWLGGDIEILNDDETFYSVMPEVQKVLDIKAAQLKKL